MIRIRFNRRRGGWQFVCFRCPNVYLDGDLRSLMYWAVEHARAVHRGER